MEVTLISKYETAHEVLLKFEFIFHSLYRSIELPIESIASKYWIVGQTYKLYYPVDDPNKLLNPQLRLW